MAAEVVGGAFLSASLQLLFDRLASREVLNLVRAKKLNHKMLDRLKTTLYAACANLNDAEYKQFRDIAVKNWLDDLKDAVYVADDLLDEISTKAVTQKEVSSFFSRYLNLHDREIGHRIEDITYRLESIVKHKDILGLQESERKNVSIRLESTSLVDASDIYGRDRDKRAITNLVLDDRSDSKLSVIPIVGMGGIGKTTLAQLVYNDDKVKQNFDLKAWVCVSEEYDVCKVTKTIIEAVTPSVCNIKGLNLLQLDLKEKLSGKKFLIVLDDVWNESYVDWDILRKPFQYGSKGSKILLTTRSERVSSIVRTIPKSYLPDTLSDESCWLLFAKHARLSINSGMTSNLAKIGRDIIKKCKRLPLAIKVLGGLLGSNHDSEYWKTILKNDIWNLSNEESEIFPALRLSYHYLPPHLKQCFAYCSLFAKDYKFEKEELILLWMAEGFLQSPKKELTLVEVGSMYFDTLTSRSFFQSPSEQNEYFFMHDLMHDLSLFVAREFYLKLGVEDGNRIPKRTRHLSYDVCSQSSNDIGEALCRVESESLRTIITGRCGNVMRTAHVDTMLSKFKSLRVLSLTRFGGELLPDSIGQLIHLRYLKLSHSRIKRLPESLCDLYNLQILMLDCCVCLTMLPNNMQKLVNLHYLNLWGNNLLTEMPSGVSKLKNLHFLSCFIVGKDEGTMIGELGKLPNLGKWLEIRKVEHVRSSKEAFEARLIDKKCLQALHLKWSSDDDDDSIDSQTERDILDKLQPHWDVKYLTMRGYRGTRFPDWLGHPSYHVVVYLKLENCRNCCLLPPLGQLPSLKKLHIEGFDRVVSIGAEFYRTDYSSSVTHTPFASLEFLYFYEMPAWKEWCSIEMEAFAKLRELIIWNCPTLTGDFPTPCLSLEKLCIKECPQMLGSFIPMSVKELRIKNCRKLKFPKQHCHESLETLRIWDCFDTLPSFSTGTFPNLKELDIGGGVYESVKCFPEDGLLPATLTSLELYGFSNLETLDFDAFQHLTSLQQLTINQCPKLEKMAVERIATCVKKLRIFSCPLLEELRHITNVHVWHY